MLVLQPFIFSQSPIPNLATLILFRLLKLRRAFYACVFKEITLVGSNQGNYFENATDCSKRTLKTTVATQL